MNLKTIKNSMAGKFIEAFVVGLTLCVASIILHNWLLPIAIKHTISSECSKMDFFIIIAIGMQYFVKGFTEKILTEKHLKNMITIIVGLNISMLCLLQSKQDATTNDKMLIMSFGFISHVAFYKYVYKPFKKEN